jgi:hypothetical protein
LILELEKSGALQGILEMVSIIFYEAYITAKIRETST